MTENFSSNAKCFIEDLVHGKLMQSYLTDKNQGWLQWRVHIYSPNESNMKRSYHLDGRESEKKYDQDQIW